MPLIVGTKTVVVAARDEVGQRVRTGPDSFVTAAVVTGFRHGPSEESHMVTWRNLQSELRGLTSDQKPAAFSIFMNYVESHVTKRYGSLAALGAEIQRETLRQLTATEARQGRIEDLLREVEDPEEVFAVVYIGDTCYRDFWSRRGGSRHARDHAEYALCDDLERYAVEDGEIVTIGITLKWTPCWQCALRLVTLQQILRTRQRSAVVHIVVFYLDVYRGHQEVDPWTILDNAGIPCRKYENQAQGIWWREAKERWSKQMG